MTATMFTIVGFVISTMLIVTSPRPATAAEIDEPLLYPGVNCHVTAGGPASYNSDGWLINNTQSNITVQCPMYDNGFDFQLGRVWVIDNSATADITCCSRIRNPLGSPSAGQCMKTVGNASAAMTLSFDGPDGPGTFSYRFYQCTLPPTTSIISYRGCAIHSGGTCAPK